MIVLGKENTLHARRQAMEFITDLTFCAYSALGL
jgi:ribosomal protein L17